MSIKLSGGLAAFCNVCYDKGYENELAAVCKLTFTKKAR